MASTETTLSPGQNINDKSPSKPVSEFRIVLSQFLAATAKNMVIFDLGMTLAFPTIIIPSLLSGADGITCTEDEASWLGSILFICQPVGSLFSGLLLEPIGRKRAMLIVNIPLFIAWNLVYFAKSKVYLFSSAVMMGLGAGFMEAPILTYIGEISQPKWRGFLSSYAGIFGTLGSCFMYLLGALTDWRTAAAISISVPIFCAIVISLIPESPHWLIFHGRYNEAEKALCWLRGWVSPCYIQDELQQLMISCAKPIKPLPMPDVSNFENQVSRGSAEFSNDTVEDSRLSNRYKKSWKRLSDSLRLDEFSRRETLVPFAMVVVLFFFYHFSGISATKPFMIEIFEEVSSPVNPYYMTLLSSLMATVGNFVNMFAVPRMGKRKITLLSLLLCAISEIALGFYVEFSTPANVLTWVPITLYMILCCLYSCGLERLPWLLISEVFPLRSRLTASGITTGLAYIMGFAVTKSYINLHNLLTLSGVFGFYGVVCVLGAVYIFYCVPETEGKSFQEISLVFKGKLSHYRKQFKAF